MADFNPEQILVVQHLYGPLVVNSVAGSGKTKSVTGRMETLIRKGVDPRRILAVTFSRKAAKEMNDRLGKVLPRSGARVGTFHSVALEILREEYKERGVWDLVDGRMRVILKQVVGYQEMDWKQADITTLEAFISRCMCAVLAPEDEGTRALAEAFYKQRRTKSALPDKLVQAYARSEELRREKQFLTFDALLMDAVLLLKNDMDARQRWQSKWDFVIADEYQDSNTAQILMGVLLAEKHRNHMGVGDAFQTIYSWRGALPEALLDYVKDWPGAKVVALTRNYRSASAIIQVANRILATLGSPFPMVADRTDAGVVTCTEYSEFDEEAREIAQRIAAGVAAGGRKYRDIAVLYRTSAQSRALEEAFLGVRVPYTMTGVNFYERGEVADLLAYLRIAAGENDTDAITRCINRPFRFLGKAFLEKIERAEKRVRGASPQDLVRNVLATETSLQARQRGAAESWCELIDDIARRINGTVAATRGMTEALLESNSPAALLETIETRTGFTEWLRREEGDESTENSRVSNVRELIRVASRFKTAAEFLRFVDDTIEASKVAAATGEEVDAVQFLTIHSAKGLEWPVVYLVGVNEKILPHSRAEDPTEERRLFYVAVTRAREELHVSYVRVAVVNGARRALEPSGFLLDADLLQVVEAAPGDEPVTDET